MEIAKLTPKIDKQEMRSYLLGSLEAGHRAALEESILCDPGIYEELSVVEEELIDEYITNNLSPSERQQFETHFLITAERQKQLRFGRLLRRYLDSQPDIVPPDDIPATSVRQDEIHAPATKYFPFASRSVARGATLTVSTVVVVILMLLCWRANRKPEQLTVQENSPNPIPYTLIPGSLRSDGSGAQGVKAPPEGVNVRLNLEVTDTNFRNYRARLFREKNFVQTADKLKAEPNGEQHVVPWTIPGEVLSPGDYQIKLSGVADSGPDAFLEDYSFRVTRK